MSSMEKKPKKGGRRGRSKEVKLGWSHSAVKRKKEERKRKKKPSVSTDSRA